jgi:RNA polymerase sigma-70 factor (ECF subfamily)
VTGLTDSAQTRDKRAFRELAGPHLRDLQLHRYPILGSIHDADDALQESLLAAWRGLADFEGRPSIDTWLYRITTNSCQNTLPI